MCLNKQITNVDDSIMPDKKLIEIASEFGVRPDYILFFLKDRNAIRAMFSNVIIPYGIYPNERTSLNAIDIPLPSEIIICIAKNGKWIGDKIMNIKPFFVQTQDYYSAKKIITVSQLIFNENKLVKTNNLFIKESDYTKIMLDISDNFSNFSERNIPQSLQYISNSISNDDSITPLENENYPSKKDKYYIPRNLWEQKPVQKVCDDMRVAKFDDGAIAYALLHWRGIANITQIGTILRGNELTDSGRAKYARTALRKAGDSYYTDS